MAPQVTQKATFCLSLTSAGQLIELWASWEVSVGFVLHLVSMELMKPKVHGCTVQPCLWDGNVHLPLKGEEGTGRRGEERYRVRLLRWLWPFSTQDVAFSDF